MSTLCYINSIVFFQYVLQKLEERSTTFKRTPDVPSREREKLTKVLIPEFMSSEESCGSDDDKIAVKPLTWRSSKVSEFFSVLSETAHKSKTKQAQRQTKQRIIGDVSTRPKPLDSSIPIGHSRSPHEMNGYCLL